MPVLVSIPHYGCERLPDISDADFADPSYRQFSLGYTDAFARELYGELHEVGATVLATPYSRLFIDVNRRRVDFDVIDNNVFSARGVVRTHIRKKHAIFSKPLSPDVLEQRLARYYDPYHKTLTALLNNPGSARGFKVLIDAHTGSARGMGDHQIILGTRSGSTAQAALRDRIAAVFISHGFEVAYDVPGYSGAHTVRRYGRAKNAHLDAVQIEINSGMIMTLPRREHFARLERGETVAVNEVMLNKLRTCVHEMVCEVGRHLS